MYKISDEVINFIEKTVKTESGRDSGGKILAKAKIQKGIFQGDTLSLLQFIITMIQLNRILRKYTAGYELSKLQEKINHLMYTDDIKLFEKRIGNSNTRSQNIQSRHRDGI